MKQKGAKTIDEFREVVDALEKECKVALSATSEIELSESNNRLTTLFQALQWNVYTVAREVKRSVEARRAAIVLGQVSQEAPTPTPAKTTRKKKK